MSFRGVLLAAVAVLCTESVSAAQTSIGVLQFQRSGSVDESVTKATEQFITTKLTADRRFQVLDRSRLDAIQAERAIQGALDVEQKTQLADSGAQFVILGEVTQADIGRRQASNGAVIYQASLTYGLRVLDVSTGAITYSEQFSSSRDLIGNMFSGFGGDVSTPAGAVDVALRLTEKKVNQFLATSFPVTGEVASVESRTRNGLPETLLVTLGAADGLVKGSKFEAFTLENIEVGGRTLVRRKVIAELALVRTEGDHLSVLKVTKGGADLEQQISSSSVVRIGVKP